jgi:hypothetical protein
MSLIFQQEVHSAMVWIVSFGSLSRVRGFDKHGAQREFEYHGFRFAELGRGHYE